MTRAEEIIEMREKPPPELPTIGIKEFEPDGSPEQFFQIQHSLSEIQKIISQKRVKSLSALSKAVWKPDLHLAEVTQQSGSHWTYIGHKVEQKLYIYPEEALYLLEIGALELTYNEVSLSVQRAFSVLLETETDLSIEKYRVYSLLSNHGYKVLRHSPQNTVTGYEKKIEIHKLGLKLKNYSLAANAEKRRGESETGCSSKKLKTAEEKTFPVKYDNDDDFGKILKRIRVIQPYVDNTETKLNFDFDVYADRPEKHSFKKSCLQLPSYRVVTHRGEDPMPDINDLCKLSNKYQDEVPVIHAIVFCDYIAFYKINSVILPDLNN